MPSHLTLPPVAGSNLTTSSSATLVNGANTNGSFSLAELDGKDSVEQLEILNNQLVLENRIKEGAENLLNMQLDDSLRLQVESELDMAKDKISAIMKRIDIQSSRAKAKVNAAGTAAGKRKVGPAYGSTASIKLPKDADDISGEDFRTSLQTANNCVKDLESLARAGMLPSQTTSTSSSSSKMNLHPAALPDVNVQRVEAMSRLIQILQRNMRVGYELNFNEVLHAVLPCLADKCSKQCRAAAYRVIRHSLVDRERVSRLGEALDWYIVKTLLRDNKHAIEKEQAIKLIRTIVEVGTERGDSGTRSGAGVIPLSEPVMRALIAVAEHAEDPFRLICIQTLAEILVIDIDLAARTDTIRFLLHVLGEGPVEITPILASVFLHLVDSPRTRAYIQVGTDLEMAISAITDAYGKGPDHADRMRGCAKVVQLMLRTWSGLMYFCMDDMRAIRSLIDTLRIPSLDTRGIILDMFFDLLNIKTPAWYQTFIDGRRLTMYRKSRDAPENHQEHDTEKPNHTLKLTDQYLALLVVILTNAGLCQALTSMLEESTTGTNLSRKATLLMAEVLAMANRVLPMSWAAKIQAIPDVFCMATDYKDGENRIVGTSTISAIDSFNRNRARLELGGPVKGFRLRANSVEDAVRRGQRQVEQVKLKMSMQMDDRTFQASLLETQVMTSKDYAKWNFETLQELIEGPLLNPKRMEEAIKGTRFIRRLMTFFHPFSHQFSDVRRTRQNIRWVRLGCSLLTTLMASPEGIKYLAEDQFLRQVKKSFAQLDPFNGVPGSDPIFSKKRVADTLTYGYLEMLGTLSKFKDGIELLENENIFTAFYHLSELRSREDLIKGIVDNLDYSIDGHPRILLSKALTSSYKHIREYATSHLGALIHASPTANAWTLRLLLTQLYDPAPEVCEQAVQCLQEACDSKDVLQLVVEMQPTLDHLGDIGAALLLKFVSTPVGFRFLYDAGYIDRAMESWFNERNLDYVVKVEVFLAKVFNFSNVLDEDESPPDFDGTVPAHFYGEMAKTELGCQVLQEKGHFVEFAQFIRQHSHESEDTDLITKLKSVLWAVGNIGATDGGLHFLEEEEIIPAILEIAEKSPIPSVRGSCFFVLGLISSTSQGAEILADYHWEATLSPLAMPSGLCVPADVEKFISLPSWTPTIPKKGENRLLPPTAEYEIEAMTAIQNLANTVIANAASRSLARIKSRADTRSIFTSPDMFYRALHIISTQRYRLPVRRYIVDLFNQELNQDLVASLADAAKRLKASPSYKPPKDDTIRMSIFGRIGKSRRPSESDESDEDGSLDAPPAQTVPVPEQPTISLQPMKKIVGFAVV
ncbi:Rapamycin-insensitive companion of mTOR, N-term-domain-containing protein [Crassisporium funariophilum]|nr:Rapamycin-insensitive companion of mTOR, N-term-domain-containing protein [Crassisporium funariophilum]